MNADHVWYVSYGSNMNASRLACYLQGGRPPGARVSYPGARDHTPPVADAAVMLPGRLFFAGTSSVWGGGMGFYDPDCQGPTPGRAYLISTEQFVDVATQEMHREPGGSSPLEAVVRAGVPGGRHVAGPGRYETLVRVGQREGVAMLTFTCPERAADVVPNQPEQRYLRMLSEGLSQAHGWSPARCRRYFASCGVDDAVA